MAQAGSGKTALILGGGAPNATLMAGALVAFEEAGVRFDAISAAGAGALVGLLYLAPAGGDRLTALKKTVELGVADPIYDHFPVNYKVFHKPGAQADFFRRLTSGHPLTRALEGADEHPLRPLVADWVRLMFASLCPTDLDTRSLGLCAPVPFLEEIVDFDALAHQPTAFYLNAYNIDDREMQTFSSVRGEIDADAVRAALAFPFLYPPHRMKDPRDGREKYYYEGAAHDCLNYKALVQHEAAVRDIVVLDVLGADQLMRKPRDLYDAWMLSIIVPLVEIARDDTKIFTEKYNRDGRWNLLPLDFDIPAQHWETALDWSRSNLQRLFEVGYRSAERFLGARGAALPRRPAAGITGAAGDNRSPAAT